MTDTKANAVDVPSSTQITTSQIGLDSQTLFGMPPLDHVRLAARTGCDFVSLAHAPPPWRLEQYTPWSLREDRKLSRDLKQLLRETGIGLQLAEGFVIRPGTSIADRENDLDLYADLGACKVAAVSMEPDRSRALDEMSQLYALANQRDLQVVFEYAPPHTFNTLEKACQAILEAGGGRGGLLIDSMHFFRCGGSVEDLTSLSVPINYLQLSDASLRSPTDDYYREACFNRMVLGHGELDLKGLISAVPSAVPISLEVPMLHRVQSGETLYDLVTELVENTRSIIASSRAIN